MTPHRLTWDALVRAMLLWVVEIEERAPPYRSNAILSEGDVMQAVLTVQYDIINRERAGDDAAATA